LENVRRKWKSELKKAKTKKEKMHIDNDLRMSYRHNVHDFQA